MPSWVTPRAGIDRNTGASIDEFQRRAREGVEGYGEAARPSLDRSVGTAIGGLNSIGALRSGGTVQAMNDISSNYGQQIGAYAKQASAEAIGQGVNYAFGQRDRDTQASQYEREFQYRKDNDARERKSGIFKMIGTALGAGVGFLAGNPMLGAQIGGSLGGAADSRKGDGYSPDKKYDPSGYGVGK